MDIDSSLVEDLSSNDWIDFEESWDRNMQKVKPYNSGFNSIKYSGG